MRRAAAALETARIALGNTVVRAPQDGVVTKVNQVQVGTYVTSGKPLFVLTGTRYWVEANFKETDLTHVTVGQKAKVVLDMHPDVTWDAEVESISPATGAEFAIQASARGAITLCGGRGAHAYQFACGALAVALPVVFHLIRRTSRDRMPFSSLMFLSPTAPRLTRRSRLDQLLLHQVHQCVIQQRHPDLAVGLRGNQITQWIACSGCRWCFRRFLLHASN